MFACGPRAEQLPTASLEAHCAPPPAPQPAPYPSRRPGVACYCVCGRGSRDRGPADGAAALMQGSVLPAVGSRAARWRADSRRAAAPLSPSPLAGVFT